MYTHIFYVNFKIIKMSHTATPLPLPPWRHTYRERKCRAGAGKKLKLGRTTTANAWLSRVSHTLKINDRVIEVIALLSPT
jgi:hypothetical protein